MQYYIGEGKPQATSVNRGYRFPSHEPIIRPAASKQAGRNSAMTVCVAALCEYRIIFGVSDRMLTAGDIQFEPATSKIHGLTTSIGMMASGDASFKDEILQSVHAELSAMIERM